MTTENNYSKVLLELKTQYEQTLAELETQTDQLKTKLNSLDSLIEHPSLSADIFSILQDASNSLTPAAPVSIVADKADPKAEAKAEKTTPKVSRSSTKKKSAMPKKSASQTKAKKKPSSASSSILKMKKPYDKMLKIDAISKILQGNPGKVIHTDDLIKELFGDLSPEQHKAERGRMKTAMYRGVQLKRWIKVPKKQMCYVYESHLNADSEKATTTKTQKSRRKTK